MNKKELNKLLKPFDKTVKDLRYDYTAFNTEVLETELCPECGNEIEVRQDGKTDCPECGHKEVLPCALCPLNDESLCDWNIDYRCSAFPK